MFTPHHMSHVTCHMSCVTCHMSHVTCHMSHVTCHMSHVTCHMSDVMCHVSCVTFFFKLNIEASWWRVCYQRGLVWILWPPKPSPKKFFLITAFQWYKFFGIIAIFTANNQFRSRNDGKRFFWQQCNWIVPLQTTHSCPWVRSSVSWSRS